jgi:hypothetical protein
MVDWIWTMDGMEGRVCRGSLATLKVLFYSWLKSHPHPGSRRVRTAEKTATYDGAVTGGKAFLCFSAEEFWLPHRHLCGLACGRAGLVEPVHLGRRSPVDILNH